MSRTMKNGKKVTGAIMTAAMILTNGKYSYADYSENTIRKVDVVIRAGEWGNESQVKAGKRYDWGGNINISKHGISVKDIPKDIPLRCENGEWFISEYDINLKLARAVAKKLYNNYGVDVNLQYATSKSQDLNAAGKIAAQCEPKIYLSVHHNSYNDNSTGYFFMYNEGDSQSAKVAQKLSNSIKDNGMVPQRENRANDGYIGELNHVANENRISILGEFGYFNKAEIVKICSDSYNNYVADKIAKSIYEQLESLEQTSMRVIQSNNTEEIRIVINENGMTVKNNVTGDKVQETVTLRFVD